MRSRLTGLLIAAFVLAVATPPAQAQIGGFLKKKAKEAAQAPVKQEQSRQQSHEAAARALSSSDVVPITQESTARFKKALDVEIKLRGDLRAMLATVKTREQYDECKSEVMMSPEAQKASMAMLELGDKATPADMQKAMLKASTDVEALVTKRCGGDPSRWNDARRAERLRQIEGEASNSFAPPSGASTEEERAAGLRHGPAWLPADDAQVDVYPYLRKYTIAKERWIPYCLAEAAQGDDMYKWIKGQGNGVYVFTVEEAQVLSEHCPEVMAKLKKATEPVQAAK